METLEEKLKKSAGISDEQAEKCIAVFSAYLKERMPPVVHKQLDKIIAGDTLEESIKKQLEEVGGEVKNRAESLARDLKQAFESAFKSAKDK